MNTCHLTAIAARLGRSITWDPAAEAITGDEQAQAMTARTAPERLRDSPGLASLEPLP